MVTDPAYESLERHRAKGTTTRLKVSDASSNAWFDIFTNDRFPAFFEQAYRVLKPRSYALIMCDDATDEIIRPIARDAGFWVWPSWTWVKTKYGAPRAGPEDMDPDESRSDDLKIGMGYHGRRSTERIMVLEKRTRPQLGQAQYTVRSDPRGEGRQLTHLGWPDVFFAPRVDKRYPTQKPIELVRPLVEQVTTRGESVCDPFCGSGVVGVAATLLGVEFLLSDVSDEAVLLARESTLKR